MTNSYRKTPICGWSTYHSEKQWKRDCHKRVRAAERTAMSGLKSLANAADSLEIEADDYIEDPARGDFGPKDGKQWIGPSAERAQWLGPHIEKVMRK